ncbi:hypothetical protein Tco_1442941 [Tanacetum coccineum]
MLALPVLQGLRGERKLKQRVVYLYMGNGVRAKVEAIGISKNDVLYFNAIPLDGIYEVDMLNLVLNVNSIYNVSNKRVKLNLDFTYLWHCCLAHITLGCKELVKRDTPNKLQQRSVKCIFVGYPKETMGYYFYFPPKNKIVVLRYVEFLEKNLISQEASRRTVELEKIQDEDTSPSEILEKILLSLTVSNHLKKI